MSRFLLAVTNDDRRKWLTQCFEACPEFSIVGYQVEFIPSLSSTYRLPQADVVVVDLTHPRTSSAEFWVTLRCSHPAARLMALCEPPICSLALKEALQAGACYLTEWTASASDIYTVAQAARLGLRFLPSSGPVGEAVTAYFQRLSQTTQSLLIGELHLDLVGCQARIGAQGLDLSIREFNVLVHLARNKERYVSPSELLRVVWQDKCPTHNNNEQVRSCIKRLRGELRRASSRILIANKYRLGYRLELNAE